MFSTLTDCFNFLNDVSEYQKTLKISPEEFYLIYQIAMYPFVKKPFQPQNPSLAEIARRCSRSQETVHGYKKSLLKKGLLKYNNHFSEGRGQIENSYDLSPLRNRLEKLKATEIETGIASNTVQFPQLEGHFPIQTSSHLPKNIPTLKNEWVAGENICTTPSQFFSSGALPENKEKDTLSGSNAEVQNDETTRTGSLHDTPPLDKRRDYNTFNQSYIDIDLDTVSEISKIMSRAGVLASPMAVEIVTRFAYDFSLDMIDYAFRKATIVGQAQNLTYVAGIFNSWRKKGISTVQQALNESKYGNIRRKSIKSAELLGGFYTQGRSSSFVVQTGYSDSFYEQLKKLAGIVTEKEMAV